MSRHNNYLPSSPFPPSLPPSILHPSSILKHYKAPPPPPPQQPSQTSLLSSQMYADCSSTALKHPLGNQTKQPSLFPLTHCPLIAMTTTRLKLPVSSEEACAWLVLHRQWEGFILPALHPQTHVHTHSQWWAQPWWFLTTQ